MAPAAASHKDMARILPHSRKPPSVAAPSEVRTCHFASRLLQRDWEYVAYLPAGYATSRRAFPVLYLLHGAFGAAGDFATQGALQASADRLMRTGVCRDAIIVTPAGLDSWYVNGPGLPMQDAFLDEFIPHIETEFRVRSQRTCRLLGGVSMGGFGALRFALLRPDLFEAVALLSPAVYSDLPPENSSARQDAAFKRPDGSGEPRFDPQAWRQADYPALIDAYVGQGLPLRFLITCGDHDELGIADHALTLFKFLRARQQAAEFRLSPGGHDWPTWTPALAEALRFLLAPGDA